MRTLARRLGVLRQHLLHPVKHLRLDDWLMGIAYPDRHHLSVVLSHLLGEIIYGVGLLEQRLALVFLIAEDALDGTDVPLGFA